MFLPESRYAKLPQCQVTLPDGTVASAVKLRVLPDVSGDPTPMTADDRLDIIAGQEYGDGTMSWHIADANTELNAAKLLQPWLPDDPNEAQISVQVPEQ